MGPDMRYQCLVLNISRYAPCAGSRLWLWLWRKEICQKLSKTQSERNTQDLEPKTCGSESAHAMAVHSAGGQRPSRGQQSRHAVQSVRHIISPFPELSPMW
jgi:hypothetical protein